MPQGRKSPYKIKIIYFMHIKHMQVSLLTSQKEPSLSLQNVRNKRQLSKLQVQDYMKLHKLGITTNFRSNKTNENSVKKNHKIYLIFF